VKVLNQFYCIACGADKEYFVENTLTEVDCQNCGKVATKVRTVPKFQLPGNDPGYPTAYDAWEKKRNQKMAAERKSENT
jgi:DNA-directed RNA polymerase subunit RPC12/RpoP